MTITTKTRELIHILPDSGAVVVVGSDDRKTAMTQYINDIRGPAVASRIEVVIVGAASHVKDLGNTLPTIIDVEFEGSRSATDELTKAVQAINQELRPVRSEPAGCETCGCNIDPR